MYVLCELIRTQPNNAAHPLSVHKKWYDSECYGDYGDLYKVSLQIKHL